VAVCVDQYNEDELFSFILSNKKNKTKSKEFQYKALKYLVIGKLINKSKGKNIQIKITERHETHTDRGFAELSVPCQPTNSPSPESKEFQR